MSLPICPICYSVRYKHALGKPKILNLCCLNCGWWYSWPPRKNKKGGPA
jgi:hypothetical protein